MPIHDWTRVRAGIFHDFHQDWALRLKIALNSGILPSEYYALIEQSSAGRHPDVLTFHTERPTPASKSNRPAKESNGGILMLAETPPRVSITASVETDVYAQKSNRVVVFNDADEVVAVLEIVSSGNKSSRYRFDMFVEKALQFIRAGVHLLYIDLFPPTSRDPQGLHAAIWSKMAEEYDFHLPKGKPLTVASYLSGATHQAFVETLSVGEKLPAMPLFLEVDRYVQVPLEATYQTAFNDLPKRWRDVLGPEAQAK